LGKPIFFFFEFLLFFLFRGAVRQSKFQFSKFGISARKEIHEEASHL